ncbi:MAG: hypothetical protein Ct9H300mP1_03380 [Planctomycetaceae bacterium]|nr:MAG: hypothetical protein Ct9H300mP1_03380 [Planctomycetaceae bacterium]
MSPNMLKMSPTSVNPGCWPPPPANRRDRNGRTGPLVRLLSPSNASAASLNLSTADSSWGLRSGWFFSAIFLYDFLIPPRRHPAPPQALVIVAFLRHERSYGKERGGETCRSRGAKKRATPWFQGGGPGVITSGKTVRSANRSFHLRFLATLEIIGPGDQDLGGQHQRGDRGGIGQGTGDHLGRSITPRSYMSTTPGLDVVADVGLLSPNLVSHHRAILAAVLCDLTNRSFQGPGNDLDTDLLSPGLDLLARSWSATGRPTPGRMPSSTLAGWRAGHPPSGPWSASSRFGGGSARDDGDSTGHFGPKPLLELLAIVFALGVLDLGLDRADPRNDLVGVPAPSIRVHESLVTSTFLQCPRAPISVFSSFTPGSSESRVRRSTGDSPSISCDGPETGRLDGTDRRDTRSLLTTRPSTPRLNVLGDDQQGLAAWATISRTGISSGSPEIFFRGSECSSPRGCTSFPRDE